jgi:phosphopantetheinyl transferase
MPIVKIENINEDCTWGLWKIEETTECLMQSAVLSDAEKEELNRISNLCRKKEWLAARVLLKMVMIGKNVPYTGTRKNEICKPFLVNNGHHISLAHSFPFAGVIVNRLAPCGIDIEKPKPSLFHIAPRFLSEPESDYIQKKPMDLCLAWAAKEVLFKLYGNRHISFRDHLKVEPHLCGQKGNFRAAIHHQNDHMEIGLKYEQVEDTLICYSV